MQRPPTGQDPSRASVPSFCAAPPDRHAGVPDGLTHAAGTEFPSCEPPSPTPETSPVGTIRFGDLRRTTPVDRTFGFSRGPCIDRFYIERFLARHTPDIRGRVLEVAEDLYTRRFGAERVTHSDVLHLTGSRRATIVADLTRGDSLPGAAFDCIILTQTLQHIYDGRAAIRTLHRILAPEGTLLVSVPGISQISRYDMDRWGDYWRFTSMALRRLLGEAFSPHEVEVEAFGNVLAATAFLHGLVVGDVAEDELHCQDPDYEVVLCARARKSGTGT